MPDIVEVELTPDGAKTPDGEVTKLFMVANFGGVAISLPSWTPPGPLYSDNGDELVRFDLGEIALWLPSRVAGVATNMMGREPEVSCEHPETNND